VDGASVSRQVPSSSRIIGTRHRRHSLIQRWRFSSNVARLRERT
jgi:hypothetical protein